MSSAPPDTCACLCVVFSLGLAVTITLTYFSLDEYNATNKDGHSQAILLVWFIISLAASVALTALALMTLYYIGRALYDKVYAEAVARVEAKLQEEHVSIPVSE